MYAELIDYGPYLGRLRAFGPPEVVQLPDFAGNAAGTEHASGFWEYVSAVSFLYTADATMIDRVPRARFFAGESVPFAEAVAPYAVQASHAAQYTFAVGSQWAGSNNGPSIVTVIPGLLLLPNWSLAVDAPAGAAGDALTGVRVYRQRFELVRDDAGPGG